MPQLPSTVKAVYTEWTSKKEISVEWTPVQEDQILQSGTFTVAGTKQEKH